MKKLFLLTILMVGTLTAMQAQIGIGAGVLYGTDSELGFTGRLNYDINSKIGVYLGYSLLSSESEKDEFTGLEVSASVTSIDIDGHYHFSEGKTKPYALAGVSLIKAKAEILGISASANTTGINVGAGVKHGMGEKFALFLEGKYVIVDEGQAIFTAGASYSF